jgi:crossover junction endodeoxyribonuclease RusA
MDYRKVAELDNDVYRANPKYPNKRLFISLPLPPSVNSIYTLQRRLTVKAQRYIRDAKALINVAVDEQFWNKAEPTHWLYVDLVFYMPDRKIRDSHNCLKLLMDVLQGSVYENDYFVLPRIQSVEYDKENPRVEVLVTHQKKIEREKGLKMTHA